MHTILAARLKPGATSEAFDRSSAPGTAGGATPALIRGRALIFWDLKVPGKRKKLDAIDTDQITPAADCVSETLDTLDERWKAGAFRYLMPDFRARVHRGETFLIAGDRFAIGSSREMSPAGLKAVAEEAGLQLVVVCGSNMDNLRGFRTGTAVGDTLVAGSVEVRTPITSPLNVAKLGVSAFFDAATVYDHPARLEDQRFEKAIGGSVWVSAAFFRLNLAVAHGLKGSTRVHFGTSFSY